MSHQNPGRVLSMNMVKMEFDVRMGLYCKGRRSDIMNIKDLDTD